MNIKDFAENDGKRNSVICVLMDLKKVSKEDSVFVMKANTYIEYTPEDKAF